MIFKSSGSRNLFQMFYIIVALKNFENKVYIAFKIFQIFKMKTPPLESLFNKMITDLLLLIEKRLHRRCFPVNFAKNFNKSLFSKNLMTASEFFHLIFTVFYHSMK